MNSDNLVTPQDVCDLFNEILKIDYGFGEKLIRTRFDCTDEILNHPTIQVRQHHPDDVPTTSIVGLLNGLFHKTYDGFGAICYVIDDDDNIVNFEPTPSQKRGN